MTSTARPAVAFETLGCRLNQADSEELAPALTSLVGPEGQVLLAGIIEPAEVETMLTYATHGFLPEERLVEGDWRALRLRQGP